MAKMKFNSWKAWRNWLKQPDRHLYYNPFGWDNFKLGVNKYWKYITGQLHPDHPMMKRKKND